MSKRKQTPVVDGVEYRQLLAALNERIDEIKALKSQAGEAVEKASTYYQEITRINKVVAMKDAEIRGHEHTLAAFKKSNEACMEKVEREENARRAAESEKYRAQTDTDAVAKTNSELRAAIREILTGIVGVKAQ